MKKEEEAEEKKEKVTKEKKKEVEGNRQVWNEDAESFCPCLALFPPAAHIECHKTGPLILACL